MSAFTVRHGAAVYLDTCAFWAIVRDADLAARFTAAVRARGIVVMSNWSAAEIASTNNEQLRERAGAFLQGIADCVSFLEIDPDIIERSGPMPPVDEAMTRALRIGWVRVLALLHERVAGIAETKRIADAHLAANVAMLRSFVRARKQRRLPMRWTTGQGPHGVVYSGLLRVLITETHLQLRKSGESFDLHHAALGGAFANVAVLEDAWAERLRRLRLVEPYAIPWRATAVRAFVSTFEVEAGFIAFRAAHLTL